MFDYDTRGERATRDIVCRGVVDRIRKGHATPNGGVYHLDGPSRRRQRAARVQGHGRALRRLRLRSRGRQGRGRADRALHDGRRRSSTPIARPTMPRSLRGRRGHRRRARRQPARRQRRRQLDRVRRPCRRRHGGERCAPDARLADPDKAAIEAAHERAYAPLGRRRGDLESDAPRGSTR